MPFKIKQVFAICSYKTQEYTNELYAVYLQQNKKAFRS